MIFKNKKIIDLILLKKNIFWSFLAIFFYKIILDLSYFFIISPVWGYSGFNLDLNSLKLFESFILLLIIFSLMPKSKEKISNFMVWILVLISYVPILTLFALRNESRAYMYAVTSFWLLVFLLLKTPLISVNFLKKNQSKFIYYLISFSFFSLVFFMIYKYFGFFFSFSLTEEYKIRKVYSQMEIPFAGYLFNWVADIINPALFSFFLVKRKWFFSFLIMFLQVWIFSVTGLKTVLFAIPFILSLMWITTRENALFYLIAGLIIVILLGIFSYWLLGDLWISSLFTRRTLLTPAQLSFFYYDFFSNNPHTFLSQHFFFNNFSDYPYNMRIVNLIAKIYFNKPDQNSNNGIYGDAYMNFGYFGFIIWGFLLSIILKLLDIFSKNKRKTITIAIIAVPALSLINSALLTCLLTHGILLSLLILYLIPQEKNE